MPNAIDFFCLKCRVTRDFESVEVVRMKNGRPAFKGPCSECGAGGFRITSESKAKDAGYEVPVIRFALVAQPPEVSPSGEGG